MARGAGDTRQGDDTASGRTAALPPFQIRSQALREIGADMLPPPLPCFGHAPDAAAGAADVAEGTRKCWQEADLTRAISAAEKAGLQSYRIEVAADGTISIVVGAAGALPPV